ncbi:hypothetical protein [Streptomyces sp. 1222.5]|uniref:hypothetical protein n=1 Tax=Streptomyces sp. 1222.5 TaxID=1881026 RepID=UPI003D711A46
MTTSLRTTGRALRGTLSAGAVAAAAVVPLLCAAPAQAATSDTSVYVWATGVNVRACPQVSSACPPISHAQIGKRWVTAFCQRTGSEVTDGPYRNNWWVQADAGDPSAGSARSTCAAAATTNRFPGCRRTVTVADRVDRRPCV